MDFFGIGFPELILILIVVLIVVGPDKLPEVAGTLGRTVRKLKAATSELSREFKEMAEETDSIKGTDRPVNPKTELTRDIKEMAQGVREVQRGINTALNPRGEMAKGIKEMVDDVTGVKKEISNTIKRTIEEEPVTPIEERNKKKEDN